MRAFRVLLYAVAAGLALAFVLMGEWTLLAILVAAWVPVAALRTRSRHTSTQPGHRWGVLGGTLAIVGVAIVGVATLVIALPVLALWKLGREEEHASPRIPTASEAAELRASGRIAFSRMVGVEHYVFVARADGAGQRRLARGSEPSWSPGATRIAFTRFAPRGDGYRADFVFVMAADGTGLRRLARGGSPDWSPDGRRIAFERDGAIWVMRRDGTRLRRLWRGSNPEWAPDGRRIAFERGGFLHGDSLWVADLDGGRPERLGDAWDPAWSPEGKSLLVTVRQDSDSLFGEEPVELAVVDADGGSPRRVGRGGLFPGSIEDGAWSPDGKWIVFRCSADELCVTDAGWHGRFLRIAGLPLGSNPDPDWQPAA